MLIFKEEALQEIRQAQLWYEVQKSGLGERFRRDLFSCLRFVLENPPGYGIRKDPYRPGLLENFHTSSGTQWKGTISLSTVFGMASRGPYGSSPTVEAGR